MLEYFTETAHFGIILGNIWDNLGNISGTIWEHFGTILGPNLDNFGVPGAFGDRVALWSPSTMPVDKKWCDRAFGAHHLASTCTKYCTCRQEYAGAASNRGDEPPPGLKHTPEPHSVNAVWGILLIPRGFHR